MDHLRIFGTEPSSVEQSYLKELIRDAQKYLNKLKPKGRV